MIGIWYFNEVTRKWALFDEVPQNDCEDRLAAIRASGLTQIAMQIARRRPRAIPASH